MTFDPLVSASTALEIAGRSGFRFVDATWFMPNVPSSAAQAYQAEHIPEAVYFDIDEVADPSTDLPHMLPSHELFENCAGNLGLSADDKIVVYDRGKFVASARVWWMFRIFGHDRVYVLNGGLPAWQRAGGEITDALVNVEPTVYVCARSHDLAVNYDQVVESLEDDSTVLLDARSPGRFSGAEPEPRAGLRGGHIPSSINMYYADVLNLDGTLKSPAAVAEMLNAREIDPNQNIITTCGSGVTAAILLLAMFQVRRHDMYLYDGSWTEWALNPCSPI